ncbi:prohibitin family protein [Reichenbachiella versicolor]|uniref:prohibitin family protein n=1 Tax=Reichenbachiella versicolor TaxID=1821036 RepID=UPI000D6E369D|nr:prohibitin family protein [Reichenbachiella versicolor]
MKRIRLQWILILTLFVSSCTVVRQGEVGVKRRLGKLSDKTITPGAAFYFPFTTRVIKLPVRTVNVQITSNLPSKEGINVGTIISILYRIEPDKAPHIIETIGSNYEEVVISSVFRSASADVCSRFYAKDMYTVKRSEIENEIADKMHEILAPRGFVVEAVLLKTIQLPEGLTQAVEDKLEAEQDALRMEFILQKEKQEAQRKLIEAQGTRDAQKVLSEGLTNEILRWRSIEAFRELSQSPNSKIIITDGDTPFIVGENQMMK